MRSEAMPIGPAIAVLAGLLAFGCAEKPSVNERSKEGPEPSRPAIIRIVFDLPGDDIGSPEDQAILGALKDAVVDSKAGDIMSSGFGMGTMEMVVAIDRDQSTAGLKKIIGEVYPKARYRIVADAAKSVRSPSNGGRTATPP